MVKSVSLYLERVQRHGVLTNVQVMGATLYFHLLQYVSRTCSFKRQKFCVQCTTTPSPATVLLPLYRPTCVSRHVQLRTEGFCRCNVLLPACPCWRRPEHSDWQEDAGVLLNTRQSYLQCFCGRYLHCWLGIRDKIRPVKKLSGRVLALFSVLSEVQTCIWPS